MNVKITRSVGEIAKRSFLNKLIIDRAILETNFKDQGEKIITNDFEQAIQQKKFIQDLNINKEFTPREFLLINKKFGDWDMDKDILPTIEKWEAAGVLLWSTGLVQMPDFKTRFDLSKILHVFNQVPKGSGLDDHTKVFEGKLVDDKSFVHEFHSSEAWYWRALMRASSDSIKGKYRQDWESDQDVEKYKAEFDKTTKNSIETVTEISLKNGYITESAQGDFSMNNVPYSELSEEEFNMLFMIAANRTATLSWLSGKNNWDGLFEKEYLLE